jgi:hypothetical protein
LLLLVGAADSVPVIDEDDDKVLGTAALLIAKAGNAGLAALLAQVELLTDLMAAATIVNTNPPRIAILSFPIDVRDQWDDEYIPEVLDALNAAAEIHGWHYRAISAVIAPQEDGWRDRLADVIDWGDETSAPDWWAINAQLDELRETYRRAVTDESRKNVGRHSRDLLKAAVNQVFDNSMVPDGEDLPGSDDAKARFDYIIRTRVEGSSNEELRAFMQKTWALANAAAHRGDNEAETLASAQATVAVVRILAKLDEEVSR